MGGIDQGLVALFDSVLGAMLPDEVEDNTRVLAGSNAQSTTELLSEEKRALCRTAEQ
jgi:hypothetical protein